MNMIEIIKDSFKFPSKNTGRYAIYLILAVLAVLFAIGGFFTYAFGLIIAENYLIGGIYLIISMLIVVLISGYHLNVVRSGIEHEEEIPVFKLYDHFMTGFDNVVVTLFYFLIPTLIVLVVAADTNLFGNAIAVCREVILQIFNVFIMGDSTNVAINAISNQLANFAGSLAVTVTVALVLFVIFSFIQLMAEARLANTGSIKEALNIFESIKDLKRIGVVKVFLVMLLISVIISIIEIILALVLNNFPFLLTTFCIVITPYFVLVTKRAIGLLYSDIA